LTSAFCIRGPVHYKLENFQTDLPVCYLLPVVSGRFGSFGARDYRKQHGGFGRGRHRAADERSSQGYPKWQPRSKSSSRIGSWGDI